MFVRSLDPTTKRFKYLVVSIQRLPSVYLIMIMTMITIIIITIIMMIIHKLTHICDQMPFTI